MAREATTMISCAVVVLAVHREAIGVLLELARHASCPVTLFRRCIVAERSVGLDLCVSISAFLSTEYQHRLRIHSIAR